MEQKFYSTVEAADKAGITGAPSGVGKTFRRLAAKLGLVPTKEKGALCWTETDIAEVKANYKPRAKRTAAVAQAPATVEVGEVKAEDEPAGRETVETVISGNGGTLTVESLEQKRDTPEVDGKKIMLEAPAPSQNAPIEIHADDTTNRGVTQQFSNLPAEIVSQKRFFATDDKGSPPSGWSTPANQKLAAEVFGKRKFIGFDISGHGQGTDYALIDFDHVRNPVTGEFVCPVAEQWFNYVKLTFDGCYCELSQSGEGFHFLCRPTAGKFGMITNKEGKGILYFDKATNAKVEIFYKNAARYCMLTGNLFDCAAGAPVAAEVASDEVLSNLLFAIAPTVQPTEEPEKPHAEISPDFQRLVESIKAITPAQLAAKGYLQRSEKGAPHPTGYICPWCGSGTHVHKTGALTFHAEPNPHFACHACSSGGDVIKLLSKIYGIDNRGKDYFTLIRKAADDFCLPYESAIFDFKPAPLEPTAEDTFVRTQNRIKSCPVNLRLPDDFIFGEEGIEYVIRGKKGDKYISAALTPIVTTKVFCNPINNATEYEFAILVVDGWCKVEIPGTALGDRELVRMLNGRGAIINSPQYLNKFINAVIKLNADILPRPKSYNQTGWTSEEFEDFAFPANGKSVVRREGYDYDRILRPHGDREEWKKKFGEVVTQGGARVKTIIGFACAAFLVRPLGLPNIQLHVHGRRSIGKTPAEQFAVSPFGDPTIHGLSYSFASTPKARLEMATAFSDFPTICEELESIGKREAEKIPQDVYQFFMGTSGQALKKDGTKRESKNFSGARLTSGEHSLVQSFGNAGEFKRVLELRCNTLLDEEFASDLYGFCAKNHGLFLEDWTRYIIEHKDTISKDYNQLLKYIYADQKDNGTEKDRTQLSTLVISSVAYQHFKIATGLQQEFDCHEFEDVTNTVAMEMQSAEELDDTTRALSFLKSFVAGSDKYFIRTYTDTETTSKEEIAQYAVDCYGKIFDSGDIAFLPHALKKILEEHGGFVSAEKLINEFKAKDYLRGNDGETTYPCRIRGKLVRTVRFKAVVFGSEDANTDIASRYGSRNRA